MYNSTHVLAMLALLPNQAEVKNVELNDLWAGYIIPIKLKPSEILACDITFFYHNFAPLKQLVIHHRIVFIQIPS